MAHPCAESCDPASQWPVTVRGRDDDARPHGRGCNFNDLFGQDLQSLKRKVRLKRFPTDEASGRKLQARDRFATVGSIPNKLISDLIQASKENGTRLEPVVDDAASGISPKIGQRPTYERKKRTRCEISIERVGLAKNVPLRGREEEHRGCNQGKH